ncbi:MAG: efflux RND transporter periplasmic adaptor subunit, partial [Chitinophagaceae bacterium]
MKINKPDNMKKLVLITAVVSILISCGNDSKVNQETGQAKKAKLEEIKKTKLAIDAEINKLESEIAALDTTSLDKGKLVAIGSVLQQDFTHFIELQGKVDATDVVIVTPRGMPGQVKEIFVKKGDVVSKGKLLLKLEDAIVLQQLEALQTQLAFAQNIYNRQKNLWDENIGTEVQLIASKNSVDAIEKQISTVKESWKTTFVYAPISGLVDEVNVKAGEFFSGVNGLGPQIKIFNKSNMKIVTEIPEVYANRVTKGTTVQIIIPDLNQTYNSVISVIGASININTRTFISEAKLPADAALRLNQIAMVKIKDYFAPKAITIPINLVQTDETGKYVFVAEQVDGKLVAKKKIILVGENYKD